MGLFDFFKGIEPAPFLTEEQVQEMEKQAQTTTEQRSLIQRYIKAYGTFRVDNAEIDLMWRLGHSTAHKQVRTIERNTPKVLQSANEAIEQKTIKHLETYAQSLINRGGNT